MGKYVTKKHILIIIECWATEAANITFLFQTLIVLVGLMLSGFLISQAFQGWADEPTITTLDTIAAPIGDIQFPTVTVCNDYIENGPDNWAFLETVLNLFRFRCFDADDCKLAAPLRKDFKYVTQSVVDTFSKWQFKEENLEQSIRILDAPEYESKNYMKIVNLLMEMASNGTKDFNELMQYPVDYFQTKIEYFMHDFGLQANYQDVDEVDCNTTSCRKIKVLGKLIHQVTENVDPLHDINFGSFLRNFITFKTFSLTQTEQLTRCKIMPFSCMLSMCPKLSEKKLHALFANVSRMVGFDEKLSLFELPGILSYMQSLKNPKRSQLSTYQKCQKHFFFSKKHVDSCSSAWSKFIDMNVVRGNGV